MSKMKTCDICDLRVPADYVTEQTSARGEDGGTVCVLCSLERRYSQVDLAEVREWIGEVTPKERAATTPDALSAAVARITNYIEADLCFPMDPEDKAAVRLVLTALEERTRERREEAGKHIDAKQLLAAAQDRIAALEQAATPIIDAYREYCDGVREELGMDKDALVGIEWQTETSWFYALDAALKGGGG